MARATCRDCGKPFVAGKNVVVCPACVDRRLGTAPKARKRRTKAAPPVPPEIPAAAPAPPAPDAALTALAAELDQAKADLMDANAEAARLWREKRAVEEQLRKAVLRLKLLKAREVTP